VTKNESKNKWNNRTPDASEVKMKRGAGLMAVVSMVGVLLAGCGGDDGGSVSASRVTDGNYCGGDAPPANGQGLEVAAVWSNGGEEQQNFQAVLDEFTKATGSKVTFTSTGDDIATVLGTRLQGGSPPDVAMLPQPGLLNELGRNGSLKPIEDVAGPIVDEFYASIWRDLGTVNGTLYGVWFKAANKSTVWYNTSVFEDAGVEPPKTWENFEKVAQTISDSGVTPISIGGGDGWTLTDWFENVYLRTAGADQYDKLARHEIPWTDKSVTDALTKLAELWGNPRLIAPGSGTATFPESVTKLFTTPPGAAIVYEGDFVAGVITNETTAKVGTDADFFPFPSIDDSPDSVMGGGDVAVMLKDSPAAKQLVCYLARPESAEVWAKLGGFTSPSKGVDTAVYPDDIARRSAQQLTSAKTFRFDLSDLQPAAFGGTPSQGMWKTLQDFLANPTNVQATADQLEAAAARAYAAQN
jgi:ABC-type glycerol-3-phosphate transport system substrate-binding protein